LKKSACRVCQLKSSNDRIFWQPSQPCNFSFGRLTQTGVGGDRKKGFSQESEIKHRFRRESWIRGGDRRRKKEENRLSANRTKICQPVSRPGSVQSLLLLNRFPLHDWLLLLPKISPRRTFWADRRSPPSSSFPTHRRRTRNTNMPRAEKG